MKSARTSPKFLFVCLSTVSFFTPALPKFKVFKGLNESTGELFAVKQISLTRGLKEEINTLETEIDLMKDLDHRYILLAA